MINKLNAGFVSIYKLFSFAILGLIVLIVSSYVILVLVYSISSTWGTPIVLSPSQTRVMSFQPQVATLVLNINKQKAELNSAMLVKKNILEQIVNIETVSLKMEEAIIVEKRRASSTSSTLDTLVRSKQENIKQSEATLVELNNLNKQIAAELSAGLITSDQAAQRQIANQSAKNALTDLEVGKTQLTVQSTQLKDYSSTLGGKNNSLSALISAKQLMEMDALKSQLKLQLVVSEQNVEIVRNAMAADNRILQVAMESPYYRALWDKTPVLFVPYDNLSVAAPDVPVYNCMLQIILCYKVGVIDKVFDAEEYARHPLFKTDLKGRFATINLTDKKAANSSVLFLGSKPLFI